MPLIPSMKRRSSGGSKRTSKSLFPVRLCPAARHCISTEQCSGHGTALLQRQWMRLFALLVEPQTILRALLFFPPKEAISCLGTFEQRVAPLIR